MSPNPCRQRTPALVLLVYYANGAGPLLQNVGRLGRMCAFFFRSTWIFGNEPQVSSFLLASLLAHTWRGRTVLSAVRLS
jgi:hypothetical protein